MQNVNFDVWSICLITEERVANLLLRSDTEHLAGKSFTTLDGRGGETIQLTYRENLISLNFKCVAL